jgi:D-alanyl-D-alanine dipeptidase
MFGPSNQFFGDFNKEERINSTIKPKITLFDDNLLAYWNFNENSGNTLNDVSNNGITGMIYGASWTPGVRGSALYFDGTDDYVETLSTDILNLLPVTISAWVKPTLRSDGTFFPSNIISNDKPFYGGHGVGVNVFPTGSDVTIDYHGGFRHLPEQSLTADTWLFITTVYDNGSILQDVLDGFNNIWIGKHNNDDVTWGLRRFYKGVIDDIRIYNFTMSSGEISQLHSSYSTSEADVILNNPANGTVQRSSTPIDLTITGSDGNLVYHWDTDDNQTVTDQFDPILPVGDGLHRLYLYVSDIVGTGIFTYLEFITDDTAPEISLNSPTNQTTHQSGTIIDLTITGSNGNLIYYWDTDDNQTVTYSYDPVLPIGDGLHQLYLFSYDNVGNGIFMYLEFITDDIAPEIILNSPANQTTHQSGTIIDLTITGSNGSLIYYWDTDDNQSVTYSYDPILPIGDGLHQLYLFSYDNIENCNFTYLEFITDDTAPEILLNSPTNQTSHQSGTIIDITVTGSNGSLIYYWDSDENQTMTSSFAPILPIGDGLHQLYLFSYDNVGNGIYTYLEFITDDIAPEISLNSPANQTKHQSGTVIDVTINESNGYLVFFWDDDDTNTTESYLYNPILPSEDGVHRLYLYTSDNAGNWALLYLEFTTDDTNPIISLNNILNETIHESGLLLDLIITGSNGNYIYHWDGDINTTVSDSVDLNLPVGDGKHQLYIWATDDVGNWAFQYFEFIIDDSAPEVDLTNLNNNSFVLPNQVIDLVIIDQQIDKVVFNWNNELNNTFTDLYRVQAPNPDGKHLLIIYANDSLGHITVKRFIFTVDTVAPLISSNFTNNLVLSNRITIEIQCNENASGMVFLNNEFIDNLTFFSSANYILDTTNYADGDYDLKIIVIDSAGNQVELTYSFRIANDFSTQLLIWLENNVILIFLVIISIILLSFFIFFWSRKSKKGLKEYYKVSDYKTAKEIKKGKFPSYEVFQDAKKYQVKNFSQYELVQSLKAPNYELAKKVQKKKFPDYQSYEKAIKMGVSSFEDYDLIQSLKAPNLQIAKKIKKKGFPDYNTYQEAGRMGLSNYKRYMETVQHTQKVQYEERKQKLLNLIKRKSKIKKEQLIQFMGFEDNQQFLEWMYSLPPDSPVKIVGDDVTFDITSSKRTDENILGLIDDLIASFDSEKSDKE